jgi:hypothetical protein
MFGVDVFEFDVGLGLQLRLEEEPEDLPSGSRQCMPICYQQGNVVDPQRKSFTTEL